MSPQQKNPSPQDEDPWEQLAENLFGITYGKEHASTEPRESAPESAAPEAVTEAAGITGEPMEFPEEPADEFLSESPETPIVAAETPVVTEPPVPAASPQDAYWDALANWSWDEQEGGAPRGAARGDADRPQSAESRPPRREGGGRPQRERRERHGGSDRGDRPSRGPRQESRQPSQRPPAAQARPSVPRPPEEDAFGAGLFGDEGPQWEEPVVEAPPPHTPAAESVEVDFFEEETTEEAVPTAPAESGRERFEEAEEGPPGDRPRRRRRRRRRRSRGPETGSPAGQPGPGASGAELDWTEEESDAAGESDLGEQPPPARAPETESRRPSGRDRGDRHRRRPPAEEFAEVAWEDEEPIVSHVEEPSEPFAEDEDEDGGEQIVSYANIPTWEEAISYLLHPEQVQTDAPSSGSGGGPRGGSSGSEGRRPNRYYGKGKGRR